MGMNLFIFDTETRQLVVSSQFWLYFILALPLTAITLILGRWQIERQKRKSGNGARPEDTGETNSDKMV